MSSNENRMLVNALSFPLPGHPLTPYSPIRLYHPLHELSHLIGRHSQRICYFPLSGPRQVAPGLLGATTSINLPSANICTIFDLLTPNWDARRSSDANRRSASALEPK